MINEIRYFLKVKNISVNKFAEDIGVTVSAVNFWLSQKHQPTDKKRKEIAEYFNAKASEIFFV